MKFFAHGQLVLPAQLEANREHITLVSLTIKNQKNGCKGNILSHHALRTGDASCCAVKALVAQAVDLVWMKATDETLICMFRHSLALPWQQVHSAHIVDAVKDAVWALHLTGKAGFNLKKFAHIRFELVEQWLCT